MDNLVDTQKQELQIQRQVPLDAISRALYLVTELIEKNDPLRHSLRTLSVELILVSDNKQKNELAQKLVSLIKIAKETKLISEMNAGLILKAIGSNMATVDDVNTVSVTDVLEDDANISDKDIKEIGGSVIVSNNGHIPKITKDVSKSIVLDKNLDKKVSNTVSDKNDKTTLHQLDKNQNAGLDIGSRRKKILEIVKAKGQVTINEFIDEIQGCSSKTIQRELTSLVLSGTLKKAGERRWSKYSLK